MKLFGFGLIELLVVLSIIAILTMFAIPEYAKFRVRENRVEAKLSLLDLASAMERYQFTVFSYRDASLASLHFPESIVNNNYQLIIRYTTDDDFLISAIPIGKQANADQACGTLSINAQRKKFVSGDGSVEDCWG